MEQALFLQRTAGNQAMLRLLSSQKIRPPRLNRHPRWLLCLQAPYRQSLVLDRSMIHLNVRQIASPTT
jgi:hypothetical protein